MITMKAYKLSVTGRIFLQCITVVAGFSLLLSGCDNGDKSRQAETEPVTIAEAPSPPPVVNAPEVTIEPAVINETQQTQFNIGNKSYLFDVSDHSVEEMQALLNRAREISQFDRDAYKDLKIVMILHGPDIDWFSNENQHRNSELVDLAEELDKLEIIDMKVCETAMHKRGIKREDIPAFIESVPYAPDEIRRLLENGHINL